MANHAEVKPPAEALADCEEKVERLREENAALRYSAKTFGDLAERLNRKRKAVAQRRQARKGKRMSSKG